jgi:leader peptidase (prepilin peptidase)/N-methyltransferase
MFKAIKKKDGIGGGDFILFGGIGSIHGPIALPVILLIGSFLGCLYFIFSKKTTDSELPFGSFLILGSFVYFVLNLMNFSLIN